MEANIPKYKCIVCGNDFEAKDCRRVRNAIDVTTYTGTHFKLLSSGIMCKECQEKCSEHQKEIQAVYDEAKKSLEEAEKQLKEI